jgi:hypothetical protein
MKILVNKPRGELPGAVLGNGHRHPQQPSYCVEKTAGAATAPAAPAFKGRRKQMPHRVGMVRRVDLKPGGDAKFYGVPRHKLPLRERVRRLEQRLKYLETFLASPEERYDRLMAVKAVIREHYAMGPRMLPMKCKREVVLWPRNIAMWLCENVMVLPRSMIGAHFGRRDYGTVVHAVKQVNNRMEVDPKFREEVALLEAKVRKLFNVEDI